MDIPSPGMSCICCPEHDICPSRNSYMARTSGVIINPNFKSARSTYVNTLDLYCPTDDILEHQDKLDRLTSPEEEWDDNLQLVKIDVEKIDRLYHISIFYSSDQRIVHLIARMENSKSSSFLYVHLHAHHDWHTKDYRGGIFITRDADLFMNLTDFPSVPQCNKTKRRLYRLLAEDGIIINDKVDHLVPTLNYLCYEEIVKKCNNPSLLMSLLPGIIVKNLKNFMFKYTHTNFFKEVFSLYSSIHHFQGEDPLWITD